MISIILFVEDVAHEAFLVPLIRRIASDEGRDVQINIRSSRGGRPRLLSELQQFVRSVLAGHEVAPDYLVIATDANCVGRTHWQNQVMAVCGLYVTRYPGSVILAIPDPHIERWFLVDSRAFRTVLGRGCAAPNQKCERDRYKQLLANAVRDAGVEPLLGGIEYAEDLVEHMDLDRMLTRDASLGTTIQEVRRTIRNHP